MILTLSPSRGSFLGRSGRSNRAVTSGSWTDPTNDGTARSQKDRTKSPRRP